MFCLEDEPGVYRLWTPNGRSPGLAVSRAFGDYCVKEFGLISVPHVSQITISNKDHFLILASDGVTYINFIILLLIFLSNEFRITIFLTSKP